MNRNKNTETEQNFNPGLKLIGLSGTRPRCSVVCGYLSSSNLAVCLHTVVAKQKKLQIHFCYFLLFFQFPFRFIFSVSFYFPSSPESLEIQKNEEQPFSKNINKSATTFSEHLEQAVTLYMHLWSVGQNCFYLDMLWKMFSTCTSCQSKSI